MYVVRRVWEVEGSETRRVASLVAAMGAEYEAADKRSHSTVYFNSGTVPGEKNRVYMQWTEDVIASPYRKDLVESPQRAKDLYEQVGQHTTRSWIEFFELMTEEKMMDV